MSVTQLRWPTVGAGRADSLFEQVEREFGRGEFRGLEFLHVRAKSLINEVPKASRMPFRYTINVYRGCSHACSYCVLGDTPVLMADGRTKPIAEVQIGEAIYGTVRKGAYRRYVVTQVLDHWSTVKPAYRISLEDGTQLITSGDHRFLTERGWKHVIGSEQGRFRRPHLTPSNKLMGTGKFASPPQQGPEYRRGYLCGLMRGDRRLGAEAVVELEVLRRAREYTIDVGATHQELLLQRVSVGSTRARAVPNEELISRPRATSIEWCKGFLAGIFDAEGSYRGALRISNTDQVIIDQVTSCLRRLGFSFVVEPSHRERPVSYVRLRGGLSEHLRFFHTVDPAITRKRAIEGRALQSDAPLGVVSVEPLGVELPLFDITTGTGDFVADGVVSHNCFARPTHEYLGMNAGEDFERRIVVKVNAVELARAETAPGRWAGEHIAMGTNTDPYQRCEAKYRLTRGVIEVLVERANPFSILTKNTLILGDLELLREAVRRSPAGTVVNFSIGTLDEEVWRASEPNTPHPLRRVEAVAKLNEAGIPCGVLIAPVLPGLSDAPEQIEAVVKACLEAGARSIYPILLHLRPGVKEHYLPWLARTRPDLLPSYRRLYPRSYAPKRVQHDLSALVGDLVAEQGDLPARPNSRGIEERPAEEVAQSRQLKMFDP
ncbi:MAG: LAGLIDADG family homing endonuclease [Acidimicrobiia bacterium]